MPPFGWTCVEDNISLTVTRTSELNMVMDTFMIITTDHWARLHLTRKEWSFIPANDLNTGSLPVGPGCMVQPC